MITSPTGAAVRDIIQITGRRYPAAEIVVYPAIVQGDRCPASLMCGLEYFEETEKVDVIIIGRGGGAIEDLWGFNNVDLALMIYNCNTPIVSAVGHETDFTICDFVADLRAPTPSGAAELVVPSCEDLIRHVSQLRLRANTALSKELTRCKERLERYAHARVLEDPHAFTDKPYMLLDHLNDRLNHALTQNVERRRAEFIAQLAKLDTLSPLKVMQRGFAVAEQNGTVIRSIATLKEGDHLTLSLSDGKADCTVNSVKEG